MSKKMPTFAAENMGYSVNYVFITYIFYLFKTSTFLFN